MNPHLTFLLPFLFLLLFQISHSFPKSWIPSQETPANRMTDIINDLGLNILNCYSSHRHGNVAFSPTGLTFVLAALYEGAAGNTKHQIAHVLGLPQDKRITRIGLRDIHRRLRSYLNANAFLGGLTLNRDDIALRQDYEELLRFYGFDLINATMNSTNSTETTEPNPSQIPLNSTENGQNLTDSGVNSTTISPEIEVMANSTSPAANLTDLIINSTDNSSLPTDQTVLPTKDTVTTLPTVETTESASSPENVTELSTEPTVASIESQNMTRRRRRSSENTSESFESSSESSEFDNLSTESSTSSILTTESSNLPTKFNLLPTSSPETSKLTNLPTESTSGSILTSTLPSEASNLSPESRLSSSTSSTSKLLTPTSTLPTEAPKLSTLSSESTPISTLPPKKRRSTYPDFQNWLPEVNPWDSALPVDEIALDSDSTDFKPSELNFFTDGVDVTAISTVMYTTMLPFCYFPNLGTAAVEFPLDDSRYTVLILLPDRDVSTLVKILRASRVKLRKLRDALTPCWIQAAIPSFMLKGFVTLTSWLQKLGIVDAFEPRSADLSVMTPDLGVYARDVHQSIGVNIKNFEPDGNETQTGNLRGEPIPFMVDRPFIFFIIDTETSVSLIAGRVNDPLNSRIV